MELDEGAAREPVESWQGALLPTQYRCAGCDTTFRTDGHPGRCFACGRFAQNRNCVRRDCTCKHGAGRLRAIQRAAADLLPLQSPRGGPAMTNTPFTPTEAMMAAMTGATCDE